MIIRILDQAEQNLVNGFRFYESQQSGLGDYFLNSLFSDIDSLRLYAGIHPKRLGFYRLLSQRFPFAIYYLIENQCADVWAVLDCRQNPSKTKKRLELDSMSGTSNVKLNREDVDHNEP